MALSTNTRVLDSVLKLHNILGNGRWLLAQLKREPLFVFALVVVIISVALAAIGPTVVPYDPASAVATKVSLPPPKMAQLPGLLLATLRGDLEQPVHWFGTDSAGLDVFSRVLAAPRVDITIALTASLLSMGLGSLLGLFAGYSRSWMAEALMRLSDVVQSFPVFILAMVLVTVSGRNLGNLVVALAVLFTPIYIRLVRSQVLSLRERPFVEAARAIGNSELRIALTHVLPNALTPALIQTSVTIGWAILLTAGLSFVGAGVRPPTPEWGAMISTSASLIILGEWWPSVFPGIAISLTVFSYAVVGDTLERKYAKE